MGKKRSSLKRRKCFPERVDTTGKRGNTENCIVVFPKSVTLVKAQLHSHHDIAYRFGWCDGAG